ncbi:hypothetical protein NBO_76g0007 [Nosema bombycis CQ1]|uniref:Uncharacterized protein n=1 Tax=Nosema bombycis (strain CQ1 / CVCC 102059) TaxID=578461 RepID=R0KT65_NOSB1|nr:hypothetical protein NBO_76g0007 [Nosema bombycis CQ1]|eukprot:EOB13402.1 hypothetical protein NBO_76g0007 [Nosema bombycis CQ1]
MSSDKLAIFIVVGIVALVGIGVLVYMLFFKNKDGKSGAGSIDSVLKNANLKEPVKKLMEIDDDKFSLFIAGVYTATCLSKDDFKKIFEMKEEKEEEKKNTKTSLENFEKAKSNLVTFLGLKDEKEIEKSVKENEHLKSIKNLITDDKKVDVSKKDSEPLKNIIANIQKVNDKEKDLFTKKISDKKEYNIVEGVICSVTEIFKGCISSKSS